MMDTNRVSVNAITLSEFNISSKGNINDDNANHSPMGTNSSVIDLCSDSDSCTLLNEMIDKHFNTKHNDSKLKGANIGNNIEIDPIVIPPKPIWRDMETVLRCRIPMADFHGA